MKDQRDREFHFSPGDPVSAEEFRAPREFPDPGEEFPPCPPPDLSRDEYLGRPEISRAEENGGRHRRLKRLMLLPIASTVAVVSVVFSAFQYDPLGNDFLNAPVSSPPPAMETPVPSSPQGGFPVSSPPPATETPAPSSPQGGFSDAADDAFPLLGNLEPNGPVEGYGVLNEEYILLESSSGQLFLLAGSAWGHYDTDGNWQAAEISQLPGIAYDPATNTLTLDHYSGPLLNVNLMGNGFTIRLIGDNYLDCLLVWGFYYGGSVTITGSGSLTVNRDMQYPVGIDLRAEFSQSCLMVDSGVRVEAYGTEMAVLVRATAMEKAIYYLNPLTLSGGVRMGGDYVEVTDGQYPSEFGDFRDYTVVSDESGTPSLHVVFQ